MARRRGIFGRRRDRGERSDPLPPPPIADVEEPAEPPVDPAAVNWPTETHDWAPPAPVGATPQTEPDRGDDEAGESDAAEPGTEVQSPAAEPEAGEPPAATEPEPAAATGAPEAETTEPEPVAARSSPCAAGESWS